MYFALASREAESILEYAMTACEGAAQPGFIRTLRYTTVRWRPYNGALTSSLCHQRPDTRTCASPQAEMGLTWRNSGNSGDTSAVICT